MLTVTADGPVVAHCVLDSSLHWQNPVANLRTSRSTQLIMMNTVAYPPVVRSSTTFP